MQIQMDEGLNRGERVRVTWEGAFLVNEELTQEFTDFEHFGGLVSVPVSQRLRLSVDNPQRVWVQSLDPDKVRERITGEFLNPDAVLLQAKLDEAKAEITKLRAQITQMREGYETSQTLWKRRHRDQWWLTTASVEGLPAAIEQGEPEPDPIDW
jgi:hypothetical protein